MALRARFVPSIRSMQEARDALAEVLELSVRRMQIIVVMQKIMLCRTHDTRRFLGDSMAGLLEGGLEYMRRRRREAIEAIRRSETASRERTQVPAPAKKAAGEDVEARIRAAIKAKQGPPKKGRLAFEPAAVVEMGLLEALGPLPEEGIGITLPPPKPKAKTEAVPAQAPPPALPSLVENPEEMKEIEELGTELDALSLAAVAREIFPDLKTLYQAWEVGRAIYMDEKAAREAVLQGARLKDQERATMLAPAFDEMKRLIENRRPRWAGSLPAIRACVDEHFQVQPQKEGGPSPQQVLEAIAMSDSRAMAVLKLIGKSVEPGVAYVADLRGKLEKLMEIEQKAR